MKDHVESLDEARESARPTLSLRAPQLFLIFTLEAVAIAILRRPVDMSFGRFAFFEHGSNLALQYLISSGLRPAIDFGYQFGLLPALVGKIWFGCLGLTPAAYQWAMLTGAILFAWALARIFAGRKIGAPGLALLIVSFGFAYQSSYPNLSHCGEVVILAHALAAHIRGSYRSALALATVAVFDKPVMGYVYGALLLLLIVLELRPRKGTFRDFIAAIIPAAIVFLVLSVVLIAVYGARSFVLTIVPIEGAHSYWTTHWRFLGAPGSYLWYPKEGLLAYFLDIPGFWMASTLFLVTAAAVQAMNYARGKGLTPGGELIITCAILHLSFVSFFFGSSGSWLYYSYLLAIGCALATEIGRNWRRVAVPLCVLAALSRYSAASEVYHQWEFFSPHSETAGLWSLPGEADEWNRMVDKARHEKMVVLDTRGAVELMYPEFGKPISFILDPGLMTEGDIARKVAQLSTASAFVLPKMARIYGGLPDAPEIDAAMSDFDLDFNGYFFEVYQRRPPKAGEVRQK
jgi:hypothetical protein